jgi:hypothetical protein
VLVLESTTGSRIYAKYHEHDGYLSSSPARKQSAFEKAIHDKIRAAKPTSTAPKGNAAKCIVAYWIVDQIALVEGYAVLYKVAGDVAICMLGRSEESNELLIYGAVETLHDALHDLFKYQQEREAWLCPFHRDLSVV